MFLSRERCYYDIRGLTMIEVMVAMALGMIVTTVVFVYYSGVNSNGAFQHEISKLEADLNAAADRMEIDIMNAGCNPPPTCTPPGCTPPAANSNFSTYAIYNTYSGTNSIFITADLDKNQAYSGDNERVLYRWNRTKQTIERTYWDYINNVLPVTPYVILNNVTNFSITYYEPYNATYCPTSGDYNCNGVLYECNMNQKLADTTYFATGTVINNPTTWSNRTSQYTFASTTIAGRVDLVILDITVETSRNDPETGQPKEISLQKWIRLRNR